MEKATLDRAALSEALYGVEDDEKTTLNIARPPELINDSNPCPSIIPGVEYPVSQKGERIKVKTWAHCNRYWLRMLESVLREAEDSRQLSMFRDLVEKYREEI